MFTQGGRRGESHGATTHPHSLSHHDQHGGGGYAARQAQEDWRRDRDDQPPPRRPYHFRRSERSGVLEWTAAVVFTVLAVAVLLAAVAVLVVVLLLQPRAPYLAVRAASLDALVYDQQGALDDVQVSAVVEARNGNARSAAAFSRLELRRAFAGTLLARLRADPFRVPPKGSLPLAYVARARGAPLGATGSAAVEAALREGVVPFGVDGEARTAWKVAGLVGVHHWTRLACELRFAWPNGTAINLSCSSKSKFWFF
ncbi:hypothetical protein BS78_07G056600 [Paspalum vaginatum]|nr:hypothetical protein BS78_07G056600 [Paspalum vaginatum]